MKSLEEQRDWLKARRRDERQARRQMILARILQSASAARERNAAYERSAWEASGWSPRPEMAN